MYMSIRRQASETAERYCRRSAGRAWPNGSWDAAEYAADCHFCEALSLYILNREINIHVLYMKP